MENETAKAFKNARDAYEMAKSFLNSVHSEAGTKIPELKLEHLVLQLDWIIQASLLVSAINNEAYEAIEGGYIKEIATQGDVLELFNLELEARAIELPRLEWQGLCELICALDSNKKRDLVVMLCSFVEERTELFVKCLFYASRETHSSLCELLLFSTYHIIAYFSKIGAEGFSYADIEFEEYLDENGEPIEGCVSVGKCFGGDKTVGIDCLNIFIASPINKLWSDSSRS